jgi:hypothetical protein
MTNERRLPRYPLEALRRREGWRLEALQAELAAASRKLLDSNERYDVLCREYRAGAAAAAPIAAAAIDPIAARNRLLHLSDMLGRMKAATQAIGQLEESRERIQARSGQQSGKLESIDRHRQAFLRVEATQLQRRESAEADRDWLARLHWRAQAGRDADASGAPSGDLAQEETP